MVARAATNTLHNNFGGPLEHHKHAPNLEIFKVGGCKCYVSLTEKQRDKRQMLKTESVRAQAVHLGYDKRAPGYYVYIPQHTLVCESEIDARVPTEW